MFVIDFDVEVIEKCDDKFEFNDKENYNLQRLRWWNFLKYLN